MGLPLLCYGGNDVDGADDDTIAKRREAMLAHGANAWKPIEKRKRNAAMALKAYAALTTSAAHGAVRVVPE